MYQGGAELLRDLWSGESVLEWGISRTQTFSGNRDRFYSELPSVELTHSSIKELDFAHAGMEGTPRRGLSIPAPRRGERDEIKVI
ncbi:MAG: hypothetical protein CBC13_10715 [Planctomycetia bacterium TMED53]|nr:MAG: hypothetical protein CBC13_10715 [Planctomycetia bacterium TMED53]